MRKKVVAIESSAVHLLDSTIESLRKLKNSSDETYDSLIKRLISCWRLSH